MLDIRFGENGEIVLAGRFDASQQGKAEEFLEAISGTRIVDLTDLEYVSSAGLGVLLATQKRLMGSGGGLKLVNASKHIKDILRFSGFDRIFEIG